MSVEIRVLDLAGSEIQAGASDPLPYPAEAYLEVEVM
jgi:hypothetical protein